MKLNLALALSCCAAGSGYALELRMLDGWSDTFPATTTVWRVEAETAAPTEITWALNFGGATVNSGQRTLNAGAGAQVVELPVRIPPLRDAVAGQASLSIQAVAGDQTAQVDQPVWILPVDPWNGLRTALKTNPPHIFDPENALSPRLRDAGLASVPARNPAAIAALSTGLLIVGEGVSLRAQRGLPAALIRAAAAGARVILLAPADGVLPLPDHADLSGLPRPALRLEGPEAAWRLDKRLDTHSWPGRPAAVASAFLVSSERRQPEAVWAAGASGWAWLDLDFRSSGGGRLLAVGWAPAKSWDAGPAPRHVLAALVREALGESNSR